MCRGVVRLEVNERLALKLRQGAWVQQRKEEVSSSACLGAAWGQEEDLYTGVCVCRGIFSQHPKRHVLFVCLVAQLGERGQKMAKSRESFYPM